MSEGKFESVLRELRETAPPAPERLRDRVRALPEPTSGRAWRLRPALAAAAAIAIAVGIGAAAIGGLNGAGDQGQRSLEAQVANRANESSGAGAAGTTRRATDEYEPKIPEPYRDYGGSSLSKGALAPMVPSPSRLQNYAVMMSLRVRDLSRATKSAVGTTRKLDGYVANANYSTDVNTGVSTLELRVPVDRVQQAIASFTNLGTILSQRIAVTDLQASVDRVDRRIAAARKTVTELDGRTNLTSAERARLDAAKRTIARLSQSRTRLVREGTYAKISLSLTTKKPAAKQAAPGRFERFWGDAGNILGQEAIIVLYALVVAGPFAILAAFALLGERRRRRRADGRLLEETG